MDDGLAVNRHDSIIFCRLYVFWVFFVIAAALLFDFLDVSSAAFIDITEQLSRAPRRPPRAGRGRSRVSRRTSRVAVGHAFQQPRRAILVGGIETGAATEHRHKACRAAGAGAAGARIRLLCHCWRRSAQVAQE